MRIIHIVENLDKGAVENWLVRTFLESIKYKPEWEWTFYCILGKEGRLDKQVIAAGGNIIYAPVTISRKMSFLKHLRSVLKAGQFDIIHSHHDYLSGFYLLSSFGLRFKKRVLHIHNTDKSVPVGNRVLHKILIVVFRWLAFYFSDIIIGISKDTLQEFVGNKAPKRHSFHVLYYGIDLSVFEYRADKVAVRNQINVPADSKVMLFIGRMNAYKNPLFVIDILSEILKRRKDVYAVFIGKGHLEPEVSNRAKILKVEDHTRLLGWRNDTAAFMKSADVFVFPRIEYPKEGLGLVVVEAQAAGLPMVISHGITEDAIIIKELTHRVKLRDNPQQWAKKILEILDEPQMPADSALSYMQQSGFQLGKATENLLNLYLN